MKTNFHDRIVVVKKDGSDWVENDEVFPKEIILRFYKYIDTKERKGHELIEEHTYKRST